MAWLSRGGDFRQPGQEVAGLQYFQQHRMIIRRKVDDDPIRLLGMVNRAVRQMYRQNIVLAIILHLHSVP